MAFGDAFVSMQEVPSLDTIEDNKFLFVTRFIASCFSVYKMILGDFDLEDGYEDEYYVAISILFIFLTLFVMIVMLNLLIAIISDIFAQNLVN